MTTKAETLKAVKTLLSEKFDKKEEDLSDDTKLNDVIGSKLNSLTLAINDKFKTSANSSDLESLETIEALADWVHEKNS